MNFLNEHHILLFLVQVLVLLGCARTLSVIFGKFKIPAIAGDIMAGVILGPTLFGRLLPDFQQRLFPIDASQSIMLETVSWLGVFFLLLSSGFHVNIKQAVKSGKSALLIGIIGVLIPVVIGYPIFYTLDSIYWGPKANGVSFSLFLAVAASITAISVVARTLGDLGVSKLQTSLLALSACAINDIFGWFLFSVVMSLISIESWNSIELITKALSVIGFVTLSVSIGSRVLNKAMEYVQKSALPQPSAAQTLIVSVGLLCGAITQWLGIHAILGFFLAGIIASNADNVHESMQESVSNTLHAIFVPLFFATLGLHVDFLTGLELWPTVIFFGVAILGKFLGALIGAKVSKEPANISLLMGFIFIPGGAMEIVVASLAYEIQLISQSIFVAIVFTALISSIIAGPLIGIQMRKLNQPVNKPKPFIST